MAEKIISIFGTAICESDESDFIFAYQTGKLLAQSGFTIANGGYNGTMLAAAKGAVESGGKTIGVTCSAFKRSGPNQYIKKEIITSTIDERLDTLIRLGQAYIVLPGSTGTLLELTKVWELKNKGFLSAQKQIILAGKFWHVLVDLIASVDAASRTHIIEVDTPEQIIEVLTGVENKD